jgi:hypothetical protein
VGDGGGTPKSGSTLRREEALVRAPGRGGGVGWFARRIGHRWSTGGEMLVKGGRSERRVRHHRGWPYAGDHMSHAGEACPSTGAGTCAEAGEGGGVRAWRGGSQDGLQPWAKSGVPACLSKNNFFLFIFQFKFT